MGKSGDTYCASFPILKCAYRTANDTLQTAMGARRGPDYQSPACFTSKSQLAGATRCCELRLRTFDRLQVASITETLVNWTSIGYRPDVVITGSGAHSLFSHFAASEFESTLGASVGVWQAWRRTLVRPHSYIVALVGIANVLEQSAHPVAHDLASG